MATIYAATCKIFSAEPVVLIIPAEKFANAVFRNDEYLDADSELDQIEWAVRLRNDREIMIDALPLEVETASTTIALEQALYHLESLGVKWPLLMWQPADRFDALRELGDVPFELAAQFVQRVGVGQ